MPKVSQEHLDSRKAQILEGARGAFAEYGYDGATVKRLEEATGLSRGAIFHYFENKNDLFVELAMEMNTRFGDILLESGLDAAFRALDRREPGVARRADRDREPHAPRRGLRPAARGEGDRRGPAHSEVVRRRAGGGPAALGRLGAWRSAAT